MNRLLTITLLCVGVCFIACQKDKSEKLPPAIQAMADANGGKCVSCGTSSIDLYEWNGQKVYMKNCSGGITCYCFSILYDAQGVRLDQEATGVVIHQEAKYIKRLWTCKEAK